MLLTFLQTLNSLTLTKVKTTYNRKSREYYRFDFLDDTLNKLRTDISSITCNNRSLGDHLRSRINASIDDSTQYFNQNGMGQT